MTYLKPTLTAGLCRLAARPTPSAPFRPLYAFNILGAELASSSVFFPLSTAEEGETPNCS